MRLGNIEKVNVKEVERILKEYEKGDINKSDCIRMLFDNGMEVKEISKEMKIIYNMVYNIVKKYVIRNDYESLIVKEEKVKVEDEIYLVYNELLEKNNKVKKSELMSIFIKKGRGESYIYSKLKLMDLKFSR